VKRLIHEPGNGIMTTLTVNQSHLINQSIVQNKIPSETGRILV
jgi:hypothetical protein